MDVKQPITLYFDTETTGVPDSYVAHPKYWPRIVQIAWVVSNSDGRIFEQASMIVKPEGFVIPDKSIEIHGITNEKATAEGRELKDVMTAFGKAWRRAEVMCCHNVSFDLPIVMGESYRLWGQMPFSSKPHICTMKQTGKIVQARKENGHLKSWPSLADLCAYCGVTNTKAHDALGDVLATWECHQYLINQGHVLHGQLVQQK